jgi:acetoin utilization deacetylase AcuC-like enzyme
VTGPARRPLWTARGYQEHQRNVVPYVFPTAGMLDTMTLVSAGTWRAARAAIDAALTAADLVVDGARVAYAICRPPGHHATSNAFGGSCYLNNAAVAVEALRQSGAGRVAVIDIDAYHGNGTQAIFYNRADVFYAQHSAGAGDRG